MTNAIHSVGDLRRVSPEPLRERLAGLEITLGHCGTEPPPNERWHVVNIERRGRKAQGHGTSLGHAAADAVVRLFVREYTSDE